MQEAVARVHTALSGSARGAGRRNRFLWGEGSAPGGAVRPLCLFAGIDPPGFGAGKPQSVGHRSEKLQETRALFFLSLSPLMPTPHPPGPFFQELLLRGLRSCRYRAAPTIPRRIKNLTCRFRSSVIRWIWIFFLPIFLGILSAGGGEVAGWRFLHALHCAHQQPGTTAQFMVCRTLHSLGTGQKRGLSSLPWARLQAAPQAG